MLWRLLLFGDMNHKNIDFCWRVSQTPTQTQQFSVCHCKCFYPIFMGFPSICSWRNLESRGSRCAPNTYKLFSRTQLRKFTRKPLFYLFWHHTWDIWKLRRYSWRYTRCSPSNLLSPSAAALASLFSDSWNPFRRTSNYIKLKISHFTRKTAIFDFRLCDEYSTNESPSREWTSVYLE